MVETPALSVVVRFGLVGVVCGALIGLIRTAAPDSPGVKYLVAAAFILPLSYVLTEDLWAGLSVLVGATVGVAAMFLVYRLR